MSLASGMRRKWKVLDGRGKNEVLVEFCALAVLFMVVFCNAEG